MSNTYRCVCTLYKLFIILLSLACLVSLTGYFANHVVVEYHKFEENYYESTLNRNTRLNEFNNLIESCKQYKDIFAYTSIYSLLVLIVITYLDVILRR